MKFGEMQLVPAVRGAKQFAVKHKDKLPRTTASAACVALDPLLDDLLAAADQQDTKARQIRGEVAQVAALREALFKDHLSPIIGAVRLVTGVPQLEGLVLPKDNHSITRTAVSARAIAETVAPYEAEMIKGGVNPGFIDQLHTAIAALETGALTTREHRAARVNATKSLEVLAKRARRVLAMLDRLMRSELGKDSPILAEWINMRRVNASRRGTDAMEAANSDVTVDAAAAGAAPATIAPPAVSSGMMEVTTQPA